MEDLIQVRLYEREMNYLKKNGHTRVYGITKFDHELNANLSILPEKFIPLFCDEAEDYKYPTYYCLREDNDGYDYTLAGLDLLREVYALRYVPGCWTISDGDYLYVFADEARCLAFLHSRKDFNGFLVRTADGSKRKIQITINLVECSGN